MAVILDIVGIGIEFRTSSGFRRIVDREADAERAPTDGQLDDDVPTSWSRLVNPASQDIRSSGRNKSLKQKQKQSEINYQTVS